MFELPPPDDDNLYIPGVGSWSIDKHHCLRRYIDIFTTGMKNQSWSIHYIDLFAGAGIERVKQNGLDWGSPLIAAQAPTPFAGLHLCELKKRPFKALEQRTKRFPQPNAPQLLNENANVAVHDIVSAIPITGTLSLAFLDPYGLHLHFDTLRILTASNRRVDLIIFFPDHLDALRNFAMYHGGLDSNLDLVLGTTEWRKVPDQKPANRWAESLRGIYVEQIRTLGYEYFDYERIARPDGVFLYQLIFCSRHPRGGEYWRKITRKSADGQTAFDFGDA